MRTEKQRRHWGRQCRTCQVMTVNRQRFCPRCLNEQDRIRKTSAEVAKKRSKPGF